MTSPMLTAALELARNGWRVFPCIEQGPKAKAPYTTNGHLDATDDPDVIRARWTEHPKAMIGAAVPETLLVLDIDPRNGGSVEALEAAGGALPDTLTCWSGRGDGGRHLYYQRPYGDLTSTKLPKGIDLKAKGYCILPPSIHPASGEPYRWEVRPAAALTPRLRDLLRPSPARQRASTTVDTTGAPLIRLVLSLKDGERNRGFFWAACRAAEKGILDTLEGELVNAAMSIGLTETEARRTVASAARTGKVTR